MKDLKKFLLTIIIAFGIYSILILPHNLLIVFGFGLEYPMWLCTLLGIISGYIASIIMNKK